MPTTPKTLERYWHPWPLYIWLLAQVTLIRILAHLEVYLTEHLRPQVGDDVTVEKTTVASREEGYRIPVHIYKPKEPAPGLPPVHVNVHGSGFCVPAYFGNSRWPCYLLASKLKCIVIDVNYRKAPNYPFPHGREDVIDVIGWVLSQPQRFDTSRISMSGFSSGGSVAFSAASEFGPEHIRSIACYYAPLNGDTDDARNGTLVRPKLKFRSGVVLIPWVFRALYYSYIPPGITAADYRISVHFTPTERLPKHMFFAAGDSDSMYREVVNMYNRIKEEGSPEQKANAILHIVKDEAHAFDEQARGPESERARDEMFQIMIDVVRRSWE